jgi:3-oxoacyl-[acyl-carrier-protein] synthase II
MAVTAVTSRDAARPARPAPASGLALTGLGVVAATGVGREAFAQALARGARGPGRSNGPLEPRRPQGPDEARADGRADRPDTSPFVLEDFDVRSLLGRRGTSFLDRCTGLALVACSEALRDSGLDADPERAARIGVNIGTTTGSLRSMSDYTRDTLVEERPYLVNPGLFPNTVMNCAAGQAAIRHGLRGINCTIAGGPIAFYGVLRVAARALRLGYLDATLAGAVEEFSPHRAWQSTLARANGHGPPVGEGASVLVLERAADARAAGRHIGVELLAVGGGFHPGGETDRSFDTALARQIERVLADARVAADELEAVACTIPSETGDPALADRAINLSLGGHQPRRLSLAGVIGDCGAATAALQVAALVCEHRTNPALDGRCSLTFGWTPDGGVAAAVIKGFSRDDGGPA